MSNRKKVLLIEDDIDDVEFLREAFDDNGIDCQMDVISDGGLVAPYIDSCKEYPGVVVLDFNLPRVHGRDLLKIFKIDPAFKNIPVIILTTSSSTADMEYAYREGADKFLIKPATVDGINEVISVIAEYI